MAKNSIKPMNPDYTERECESPTHACGRCGREFAFPGAPALKSPCCGYVLWSLRGGPRTALPPLN